MLKNCKLSFEIWGLLLFLIVMIPNFMWFAIPAPNDILREKSITEIYKVNSDEVFFSTVQSCLPLSLLIGG